MTGEVEICNLALANIGEKPIQDFDETAKAQLCRSIYLPTRDEVLRAHAWNFATRRKLLSPLEEPPEFEFSAAFALPPDCLRVLDLGNIKSWVIEGRSILANVAAIQLRYVARIEDCNLFDALFRIAFGHRMSSKLAMPLTGNKSLKDQEMELYSAVLGQARIIDAQEEPGQEVEESSLLTSRY